MKTFELKSSNKKTFATFLIPFALLVFTISFAFLPSIIRSGNQVAGIAGVMVALVLFSVLLRKVLTKKYEIQVSEKTLEIRKNGVITASVPVNSVVMLKLRPTANSNEFTIYTNATNAELIKFDAVGQLDVIQGIINELQQYGEYHASTQSTKMGDSWTEYINKTAVRNDTQSVVSVQENVKKLKQKNTIIIVSVVAVILFLTILPFFINPKAFYEREGDKIFYGKKELVGVNPQEVVQLGYKVLKDSSHIYYKGDILEWADRETFELLQEPFYMDKNGIYYETSNFYSKNKIVPLEGDYDAATFHKVDKYSSFYYKDKNNLYHLEINLLNGSKEPLRKVVVPGLDVATFEGIDSHYWYKDKNKVYFSTWDELRPCNEIAPQTFEVLSWQVAKDKNNVYYLTRDLSSDAKEATKKEDYAILQGAHAPSFIKIDNDHYEDENTTWTITKAGEEEDVAN